MDLVTGLRSQWDRMLAMVCAVAGLVVLILGWVGVSGSPYPAEQLPYLISGGVGALFLLGVSAVLWLSADLHDEWRKLDRIEQALRETGAEAWDDTVGYAAETDDRTQRMPRVAAGSPA